MVVMNYGLMEGSSYVDFEWLVGYLLLWFMNRLGVVL